MSDITADKLASVYAKIKAKRAELTAQYESADAELQQKLELITQELSRIMKETGAESIKTAHGTISRVVKDRFWCNDWGPLYEYIAEHGAAHLLQRRISDSAMKEWIQDHKDDLPPAVNCERTYEIRLYKPRKEM